MASSSFTSKPQKYFYSTSSTRSERGETMWRWKWSKSTVTGAYYEVSYNGKVVDNCVHLYHSGDLWFTDSGNGSRSRGMAERAWQDRHPQ